MKTSDRLGCIAVVGFVLLLAFASNASAATLGLSPASRTVVVGDTFTLSILLDTGGAAIDGVDIRFLNYNPFFLQIQDADSSKAGTQISAGTLMSDTAANSVDTINGKIVFSQITGGGGSTFTGSGVLASMTFKALTFGTTDLTFDFTLGGTNDTNVASAGVDILSSVTNGRYTINPAVTAVPEPGSLGLLGLGVLGILASRRILRKLPLA